MLSQLGSAARRHAATVRRLRRPDRLAIGLARLGLAARTGFYLLLVYLIARLALASRNDQQPNAHGALAIVADAPLGIAVLIVTAAGFAGFGVTRLRAAWKDNESSVWTRLRTVLQGLFYLVLAWIPLSYALGNHSTGKEQQQHQTVADLLHLPGGPVIVFALGIVVCIVAAYQVWTGVDRDYVDGMAIDDAPRWVRRLVLASGAIGIPARALVFLPIGVFFMIAAVQGDPRHADGLDRELTALASHSWGDAVLALCAVGLLVFVVYSSLETRYREVARN
ncbi:MAG TPA: DUF1206 domain-containing protein [Mycobacteriales bacterium]|nr:DUF1206 domain-containing protein [Mycobacteriales bacterium]